MLELQQISLRYPDRHEHLLQDLSLRFHPGSLTVLKGSNGSGKTTLLNIISGVITSHYVAEFSGQVLFNQEDITHLPLSRRHSILSYQMAEPESQFFFPSLAHELSFPLENMGLAPSEIERRIGHASEYFGIKELLPADAASCSPGQQKLLIWAIMEVIDAPLILLDEPCSGVSPAKLQQLFVWIDKLKSKGKIVIAAEHDPSLISIADEIVDLNRIRSVSH